MMTNIIYIYIYINTKKVDDLIPTPLIAIQLSFSGKYYQTLSKAIWNKACVNSRDCHLT